MKLQMQFILKCMSSFLPRCRYMLLISIKVWLVRKRVKWVKRIVWVSRPVVGISRPVDRLALERTRLMGNGSLHWHSGQYVDLGLVL